MEYAIKAHPTRYGGVEFRSRLEATWAAFFDACRWRWDYEPLDLTGWVPDFVLHGKEPVAVEVKPIFRFEDFPSDSREKIEASGWTHDVLVLGNSIFEPTYNPAAIGWLGEACRDYESGAWHGHDFGEAIFGRWRDEPRLDFCHDTQSYYGRMTGYYEGNQPEIAFADAQRIWREASNLTRWRPR